MMTEDVKDSQSVVGDISMDGGASYSLQSPNLQSEDNANQDDGDPTTSSKDILATQRMETEEELQQPATPTSKYQARQRVWARDYQGGGLLYEAIVRRSLYGINNQMQVQIGLLVTEEEADQILEKEQEPGWHYFVHFLGWKVNWDRWVPEADVLEPTEETKAYANRLQSEHRALRQALSGGGKKRKGMVGTVFMREWRKRMDEIHLQMEQERRANERRDELVKQGISGGLTETTTSAILKPEAATVAIQSEATVATKNATAPTPTKQPSKKKKEQRWDNTTLERERKLREQNLSIDRRKVHAEKLILPMGLKKALVEEWEIILQCNMVANLPATVTVRQALDKYLESKLEQLGIQTISETAQMEDAPSKETQPVTTSSSKDEIGKLKQVEDEDVIKRKQEWVDMVEGIALFFDQALPVRLLYQQELNQHRAIEADVELSKLRKSELYGCEHLLRLLVHLPAILACELEDAVARPILAKVNDFVRFLHKHQASLCVQIQSYRRMNEAEEKEQVKQQRNLDRKRKRVVVSKQDEPEK